MYTDQGQRLTDHDDITNEIRRFYISLLGTATASLPKADIPTLRAGVRLSSDATSYPCDPVTTTGIYATLNAIYDTKARGLDGYNVVFFKKI